ncbi:MAG: histidine phosphatase family protein [Rhodospirillales bacterium]|nr:histidine phosphatase family protein [Rhodospirillales bacterium]
MNESGNLLILLRHGPTDWNAEGRMQGRSDRPLSAAGRAAVRRWRLPEGAAGYCWASSPLGRARQTAALLGHEDAGVEAALIETDWGDWEGARLAELRERFGEEMTTLEAKGLDFRPPGGESPREVQARLRPWLAALAGAKRPCVAVSHKGVIRALLSLATGWDMTGPPPEKLRSDSAQCFRLMPDGRAEVVRLNLPLVP